MSLQEVCRQLKGLGVELKLTGQDQLRVSWTFPLDDPSKEEVRTLLKAHKEDLRAVLALLGGGGAALPEHLARLIEVSLVGALNRPAQLCSGMVPDLGQYVMAWAASYAARGTTDSKDRLQEAHQAWQST